MFYNAHELPEEIIFFFFIGDCRCSTFIKLSVYTILFWDILSSIYKNGLTCVGSRKIVNLVIFIFYSFVTRQL